MWAVDPQEIKWVHRRAKRSIFLMYCLDTTQHVTQAHLSDKWLAAED